MADFYAQAGYGNARRAQLKADMGGFLARQDFRESEEDCVQIRLQSGFRRLAGGFPRGSFRQENGEEEKERGGGKPGLPLFFRRVEFPEKMASFQSRGG